MTSIETVRPIYPKPPSREQRWTAVLLFVLAIAARMTTFTNPVTGFDEQFYLLVGCRMGQGALPFVDIFDRKPIGLFLIYAAACLDGHDGFVSYKLIALLSASGTAFIVYRIARRTAPWSAAFVAALLYLLWLNFMEGEGGQAPVFYNLAMAAAAAFVVKAPGSARGVRRTGAAAMLFVGIAMQIKYSVVVEGIYFGCFLIWAAWRGGRGSGYISLSIVLWVGCAAAPTVAACAIYAAMGHLQAFFFSNFVSVLGQGRSGFGVQAIGAGEIVAIMSPLCLLLLTARAPTLVRPERGHHDIFLKGWLTASVVSVVAYWRFLSPQYAMPVLLPLTCMLGQVVATDRLRRAIAFALAAAALIGGQVVLAASERMKGGRGAALALARAARADGGCIYVYDGYPALYLLTRSCLPSRWVFPGHLNMADEASTAALGIDPSDEVRRILATRPVAIVDDWPRFEQGNLATHRILQRVLEERYWLVACVPTGPSRVRLVYRLKPQRALPRGCPGEIALRLEERQGVPGK